MILVDSSVLIPFFKGAGTPAAAALRSILERKIPFGITPVIFQEVLQGTRSEKEFNRLETYLGSQRFYHPADPVRTHAAAARIYFRCRRQGIPIRSSVDCLIAQIAIENDLLLLHDDRDFDSLATVTSLHCFPVNA